MWGETYDAIDVFIDTIDLVDLEDVVAEIESLKPPLLFEEGDEGTPSPVQTLPIALPVDKRIMNCWRVLKHINSVQLVEV